MKKMKIKITFLITAVVLFAVKVQGQEKADTTLGWKYPSIISLTVSQSSFSNWAAGGENSYSINGLTNLSANYKGEKSLWENDLLFAYGILYQEGFGDPRKSDDKLEFSSKYGYKASEKWFYSGLFQFKTQFSDGYNYNDDGTKNKISTFMAPGYLNLALGMNYVPSKSFSLFIGPISGKSTIVQDDTLSAHGAFGVEPGENIRNEFGGSLKAVFKKDIVKNVNLFTKLELFSNYMENPQNIDFDWQMLLTMKINKLLSANINLHMIYDDDIASIDDDGNERGPKVQFKEVFGIGFSYKF